jgi:hypothetical protein
VVTSEAAGLVVSDQSTKIKSSSRNEDGHIVCVIEEEFVLRPISRLERESNVINTTASLCECEGCGQAVDVL